MFKNLFKRSVTPQKDGTFDNFKAEKLRMVKVYELELANMEGAPTYSLKHQLTIGSEIGNIVIDDPSISPRQCTFILQDEVVSVIDHASISGTFVNGKKIPPGKYIILEETDVITVGDLQVKLKSKMEKVPEEEIPELPADEEPAQEEVTEEAEEEAVEEEETLAEAPQPKDTRAANSLVRIVAVFCDTLMAYTLTVVFLPFDEVRHFFDFIPAMLGELIGVDWKLFVDALDSDFGFVGELLKDLYQSISLSIPMGSIFLAFILLRLFGTLVFGVSFSEAILGMRAAGNKIWARIGGLLRVLIGIFTGPFLVFDVPSIVSRRTFKEFVTFTRVVLASKLIFIISTLLYVPLMIAAALMSPMFQGLSSPEPILVNPKVEKRIRLTEEGTRSPYIVTQGGQFLKLELTYDPMNISIIPMFKFQTAQNRLQYQIAADFYHKDLHRPVQLELFKTFDLKQLLEIGFRGNYFLFDKFPNISSFLHPSFKQKKDEKAQEQFANEVIDFMKLSFEITPENALDVMQTYTPLLKGLIDFKSSFLALVEYKDFDRLSFAKIGNAVFLRLSYIKQKPFDLIIPLMKEEGRIYKVGFDKKENMNEISNKFYKYTLNESRWFPHVDSNIGETLNPLQVIDLFSTLNDRKKEIPQNKAQALYGYYYEKSANIIMSEDSIEYDLWKSSLDDVLSIMENISASHPIDQPVEENSAVKLYQNFKDLKDAVENKNREYFGLEQNVQI